MKSRILVLKEKVEASAQCNVVKTGICNEASTAIRCVARYIDRYVTRHQKNRKFLSINIRRYAVW
jgi:hypothetical protein